METTTRTPMSTTRKLALAGGLFYIATFVFSIPALGMYDGVLNNPNFVHGAGSGGGVLWGALFEMLTGLTGIGTAVMLYPIIKKHGVVNAVGFVASRTLEAAIIVMGFLSLLAVYTLRQDFAGGDTAGLTTTVHALVAFHDWSFLFGPGVMATVNALFLATVLYRSRLVPRIIPTMGLVGAPVLLFSTLGTLFGAWEQTSSTAMALVLPIAAWEFSLGVWLTFKGVNATAVRDEQPVAAVNATFAPVPA
jgi:hypothetical protein